MIRHKYYFLFWVILALTLLPLAAVGRKRVFVTSGMDYQRVFASKNTFYVIKQDLDLGGRTIRIGEGSTLVFKGGSLANG